MLAYGTPVNAEEAARLIRKRKKKRDATVSRYEIPKRTENLPIHTMRL